MTTPPTIRRLAWRTLALAAAIGCGTDAARVPDSAHVQASATPAVTAGSPATDSTPRAGGTIVFAGTSLTAGLGLDPDSAYPQLIQRKLDSAGLRLTVVNAGVSGETSSGLLRRLDWLLRQPVDVMVIETGANDGLRGIPTETLERNLQRIVDRVRKDQPSARVILVQMEAPPNLGAAYTRRFHALYGEVARRNGIPLLPFLLDGVAGRPELNQGDGMHPNVRGERIVAENVWKGLKPVLQ